ncbi:hypothetical protein Psuf_005360 [Phytohabitans suffuscus]|uniref:Major facilitator superfamily (MFS) profile domain-containing protein n=1 Tax=Phytohabitans suffuscus TaxID=624315 RepID=A0A6F8YB22_9ACTN|nr:hypothetical protein [Phytohabitans suffuscus]BCB83223.1 hypothetical protein Psuf_005360 [Phytohabitans suffuscus]
MARSGQESVYHSVYWLNVSLQQIAAPVALTVVVATGTAGWLALAAVLGAAGLAAPAIVRWAQSRLVTAPEEPVPAPA